MQIVLILNALWNIFSTNLWTDFSVIWDYCGWGKGSKEQIHEFRVVVPYTAATRKSVMSPVLHKLVERILLLIDSNGTS